MLGKLIKYEFKAVYKIVLLTVVSLLGISIVNSIFFGFGISNINMDNTFIQSISSTIFIAFMLGIVASILITYYVIIQRFNTNLFGREGYLMHTLPVDISDHLISKILVSSGMFFINILTIFIAIFLTMFISVGITEGFNAAVYVLEEIAFAFTYLELSGIVTFFEFILLASFQCVTTILMFYFSVSVAHTSKKNKLLVGFGTYVLLNTALSFIVSIALVPITVILENTLYSIDLDMLLHILFLGTTFYYLAVSLLLFLGVKYIMTNKLNLG